MTLIKRYGIVLGLILLLLILQYRLWFQAGGMQELFALRKTLAVQTQKLDEVKAKNEALLFQIKRLQNSEDASEYRARNELGMIKKNETFYQIIK